MEVIVSLSSVYESLELSSQTDKEIYNFNKHIVFWSRQLRISTSKSDIWSTLSVDTLVCNILVRNMLCSALVLWYNREGLFLYPNSSLCTMCLLSQLVNTVYCEPARFLLWSYGNGNLRWDAVNDGDFIIFCRLHIALFVKPTAISSIYLYINYILYC